MSVKSIDLQISYKTLGWLISTLLLLAVVGIIFYFITVPASFYTEIKLDNRYLWFLLIGFLAQTVDGAIGMAYGVTTTNLLLVAGIPPATASGCVHIAKVFTSGTSGWAHWRLNNVNKKMFLALLIPGMIGVVLGVMTVTMLNVKIIKPLVSGYLLIMGAIIVMKSFSLQYARKEKTKNLGFLGFMGGFLDAVGGGGWGPVVVSSLLGKKRNPRYTIGTVNFTEFFIAIAAAGSFAIALQLTATEWLSVICIVVGGIPASLFSAHLCKVVSAKRLMLIVGIVTMALSCYTISKVFF
jgi:uncharacterized membrane protein YfcA